MPVDDRPLDEILARRRRAVRLARLVAGLGDSCARRLSASRPRSRRVFRACGCRRFCAASCASKARFSATTCRWKPRGRAARSPKARPAALQAGCDMVLICNQPEQAEKVLDELRFTPSKESQQRLEAHAPARQGAQVEQAGRAAAVSASADVAAQRVRLSGERRQQENGALFTRRRFSLHVRARVAAAVSSAASAAACYRASWD